MIASLTPSKEKVKTKVFVVDNYDSFTYNLVHYLRDLHADVTVKRNDEMDISELINYKKILLSPGPGLPADAGLMPEIIRVFHKTHSLLGICLGHQAIGEAFGARLHNLEKVYHGVSTGIHLTAGRNHLFEDMPLSFTAGRYHSWVIEKNSIPKELKITAVDDSGEIMGISHRELDVHGLQFHPESILTEHGKIILKNWLIK